MYQRMEKIKKFAKGQRYNKNKNFRLYEKYLY